MIWLSLCIVFVQGALFGAVMICGPIGLRIRGRALIAVALIMANAALITAIVATAP